MKWYCIHTKPKKEPYVQKYLHQELELATYYPQLSRKRVIRRVKKTVLEPLFPRYLFCRLELATSYRAVTYARDVLGVVSSGDVPIEVPDHTVEQLQSWIERYAESIELALKPKQGDRVKITEGPMQGLEAIFLSDPSQNERIALLLDLMNSQARVQIRRDQVEPIKS